MFSRLVQVDVTVQPMTSKYFCSNTEAICVPRDGPPAGLLALLEASVMEVVKPKNETRIRG